jgi:hypothetical protein
MKTKTTRKAAVHECGATGGKPNCATCPDCVATAAREAMVKALRVVTLDPKIRGWLEANDPMALAQCYDALRAAGERGLFRCELCGEPSDRPKMCDACADQVFEDYGQAG